MNRMKAVLTLSAACLFAASPLFSGAFRGFDPQQFPSPQLDPPIVPAGYAFSIWGLIYVYLLMHAGYGLLKRDTRSDWDHVRWPLIISLIVGAAWIPVAKTSPVWATVLIWVMLITALAALFRSSKAKDRWLLQTPLAIYAGWLTAASFVSLALMGSGYGPIGDQVGWAWVALILVLGFASVIQLNLDNAPEFGFTLVWALIAIAVRNWSNQSSLAVFALVGAAAIALIACRLVPGMRNNRDQVR